MIAKQKQEDSLSEFYLPLVKKIANSIAVRIPFYIDREDLISAGYLGLLTALRAYNKELGASFETYAYIRIKGAILDSLRSQDFVPQSFRQKIHKVQQVIEELEKTLGFSPTDGQIADKLGISMVELHEILYMMNRSTVLSLDELVTSQIFETSNEENPQSLFEIKEVKNSLAVAIDRLPDKERKVISLHYYDELSFKEISDILKLSAARICQIHAKAIARLRGVMSQQKKLVK